MLVHVCVCTFLSVNIPHNMPHSNFFFFTYYGKIIFLMTQLKEKKWHNILQRMSEIQQMVFFLSQSSLRRKRIFFTSQCMKNQHKKRGERVEMHQFRHGINFITYAHVTLPRNIYDFLIKSNMISYHVFLNSNITYCYYYYCHWERVSHTIVTHAVKDDDKKDLNVVLVWWVVIF